MFTGLVRNRMVALGSRVETCFRLQFADGTHYQNRDGAPAFIIVFRRSRAGWRVLLFGHIGLLESYFDGDVDVEGNLGAAFRVAFESGFERKQSWRRAWCAHRHGLRLIGADETVRRRDIGTGIQKARIDRGRVRVVGVG